MINAIEWANNVTESTVRWNFFWSKVIPSLEASGPVGAVLSSSFGTETFNTELAGQTVEFYCQEKGQWDTWVVRDDDRRYFQYTFYRHSHAVEVLIYSPYGAEDAEIKMLEVEQRLPRRSIPENEWVNVAFWTQRPDGAATYQDRMITAPAWDDVQINYPTYSRDDLAGMHAWTAPPMDGGRLLLLHGQPGTGKTNVIRSLARAWRQWCTMHYVVDPENFFGSAHYMMSVLLNADAETTTEWRLVIVEDADELLSVDAKSREGQNVSRLLNVCDGLVGQGLRVLVLLTSNEPVGKMHPAIVRPGRCVSNINLGKLRAEDANEWRRIRELTGGGQNGDATLAELFEELRQSHIKTTGPVQRLGFARQGFPQKQQS